MMHMHLQKIIVTYKDNDVQIQILWVNFIFITFFYYVQRPNLQRKSITYNRSEVTLTNDHN